MKFHIFRICFELALAFLKTPFEEKLNICYDQFITFNCKYFLSSQQYPYDIIIIGVKEIYQQILNVPYAEKHVGRVNVLLVCDANGVE